MTVKTAHSDEQHSFPLMDSISDRKEARLWIIALIASFLVLALFIYYMLGIAYRNEVKGITQRGKDTLTHLAYIVPRLSPDTLQDYIETIYRDPSTYSYLLVMDLDAQAIAHSERNRVGMTFYEEGFQKAVSTGKPVEQIYVRDADKPHSPYHGEKTVDILAPYFDLENRTAGVVNIGISLAAIDRLYNRLIVITFVGAIICIIPVFLSVFLRHLSTKKRTEIIRMSEENQRVLLDNIKTQVWYLTDERTYGMVNRAHADFHGLNIDDMAFHKLNDVLPMRIAASYRSGNIEVFKTGRVVRQETWIESATGELRFISSTRSPKPDANNNIQYVVCSAEDITERKRAEEELREREARYRITAEQTGHIIYDYDLETGKIQWMGAIEQTTGYSAEEFSSVDIDRWGTMIHPDDRKRMLNTFRGSREKCGRFDLTYRFRNKRDEYITIQEHGVFLPDETGKANRMLGTMSDITRQMRMQEMMIQNEKMLSVGGLAAGMAHEINNPLAGIMQTADVIHKRLSEKSINANIKAAQALGTTIDVIHEYMKTRGIINMLTGIRDSGKRVSSIVNNMLSFARKDSTFRSTHDPVGLLDKAIELASADYNLEKGYDFKSIRIERDYEDNIPPVPCESMKIQQVLLNLLRNGAQAMIDGDTAIPTFRLKAYHDGSNVCIEIADNGPGMTEEIKRRVFEPFFTTKPEGRGTGLGLSVSYFIIKENHGGDLLVESEPGSGTRFTIRLPLENR